MLVSLLACFLLATVNPIHKKRKYSRNKNKLPQKKEKRHKRIIPVRETSKMKKETTKRLKKGKICLSLA